MKKIFTIFVLMMLCASFIKAQDNTEYTSYRFTRDEFGEMYPKTDKAAVCYARIEFYDSLKIIKIFTKQHGSVTIKYDTTDVYEGEDLGVIRYYKNEELVGATFIDLDTYEFNSFAYVKNKNSILYVK